MSDVTLSASVRQSLLSLQSTTNLIERTQNRLSTGLRVSDAIDDPVAFFQAKSLSDRATDFLERKDAIDQGISTVTSALDGVEAIENLVNQLKGVSNSMKSATDAQIAELVTQFNDLRTQINNLATDATYQGTNLINGTGQTLSIEFSERTASLLNVNSVDLTVASGGLNINANAYITGDDTVNAATLSTIGSAGSNTFQNRFISTTSDFNVTYLGSDVTFAAGETVAYTYGTGSTFNFVVSTAASLTLSQNEVVTVNVASSTTGATAGQFALVATQTINLSVGYSAQTLATNTGTDDTFTITYNGTSTVTLSTADDNAVFFTLLSTGGTAAQTLALQIRTGASITLSQGATITIGAQGTGAVSGGLSTQNAYVIVVGTAQSIGTTTASNALEYGIAVNGNATGANFYTANNAEFTFTGLVRAGDTTRINAVIDQLDTALTTLRTQAQTLGSNVALLNTRLSFTEQYTNTLQGGADKLTLADINEEGANLLALQTRQQLGIQSLSLAAQAEASILSLFG